MNLKQTEPAIVQAQSVYLNYGEAHSVDFTIEIKRIDVCHTGNIVEHSQQPVVELGRMNLILPRNTIEQQL